LAFITDITARVEAEHELQKQNRALSNFAQTVAHDLKSLITAITGFTELLELEHKSLSAEDRQVSLKMVKETSYKMNDIINELLFLARAKREDVILQAIDLNLVVDEALKRLKWKVEAAGAEIVIGHVEKGIQGYQPWIEEVFYNLISNALNHGGENLTVRIETELIEKDKAVLRIVDNGDGMSDELLSALLEKPEELPHNWVKGHGLGLTIVHHILDKLGSSLDIYCTNKGGCSFSFVLPVAKEGDWSRDGV
jgi:signal transduction histidine kinase